MKSFIGLSRDSKGRDLIITDCPQEAAALAERIRRETESVGRGHRKRVQLRVRMGGTDSSMVHTWSCTDSRH